MIIMKKLPTLLIPFLLSGCAYLAPVPDTGIPIETRMAESQSVIEQRKKEAETFSLEQKAEFFERLIEEKFTSRHFLITKVPYGEVNIEPTAYYLAALAFKYGAVKDAKTLEKARNVVKGIIALDESNKLDGYVPRQAVDKEEIVPLPHHSRANSHAFLLFSYCAAYRMFDGEIRSDIKRHVEMIMKRWIENGLVIKDENGKEIQHSDLSPGMVMSRSRCLDTLLFAEMAASFSGNEEVLNDAFNHNYLSKIQVTGINILNIKIPTYATNWANCLTMFTLTTLSENPEYKRAVKNFFNAHRKERNPVYNSVYLLTFPEDERRKEIERTTEETLASFPVSLSDNEVINKVRRKLFPPIVKNTFRQEGIKPLPIYMRPLDALEWKRNPYRIDGNFGLKGDAAFSGVDYLLAYWMHMHEKMGHL